MAGLGGTLFGKKSSWGKKVVVGNNMFILEVIEVGGREEFFGSRGKAVMDYLVIV